MSIKGHGHSLALAKGHSNFKIETCFYQKLFNHLRSNFIWNFEKAQELKSIQMKWVIWP